MSISSNANSKSSNAMCSFEVSLQITQVLWHSPYYLFQFNLKLYLGLKLFFYVNTSTSIQVILIALCLNCITFVERSTGNCETATS